MQPDAGSDAKLPSLTVDPLASFLTTSIDVPIGRHLFELKHCQADVWLSIFLAEQVIWESVLPDMLSELDQQTLEDDLRLGVISSDELAKAIFDTITIAAGRKWFIALNLCMVIRGVWDKLGGKIVRAAGNPSQLTFSAWLDIAYSICLDHIDSKRVAQFVSDISKPPPGHEEETDWEAEERNFQSAMSQL